MRIKFAHSADCHLGGWEKKPEIEKLNLESFGKFIDECILEKKLNNLDFVLIAGDLFNTAQPSIDVLKFATEQLKRLKDNDLPCYISAGSHDSSISGKTMLDVLEKAGLITFLGREGQIIGEEKTEKVDFVYLNGRRSSLELEEENIKRLKEFEAISQNNKPKICVLHTSIIELMEGLEGNENIKSLSEKELPKGFDYYALGHIHIKKIKKINEKILAYPGPLFPNNFSELAKLKSGSWILVEIDKESNSIKINEKTIDTKKVSYLEIIADNKTIEEVNVEVREKIKDLDLRNRILCLKIFGILKKGRPSSLDTETIIHEFEKKGGYILLKNTNKFRSKEFEIKTETKNETVEEIENQMIKINLKERSEEGEILMGIFEQEKKEGETNENFSRRISEETIKNINFEEIWNDN